MRTVLTVKATTKTKKIIKLSLLISLLSLFIVRSENIPIISNGDIELDRATCDYSKDGYCVENFKVFFKSNSQYKIVEVSFRLTVNNTNNGYQYLNQKFKVKVNIPAYSVAGTPSLSLQNKCFLQSYKNWSGVSYSVSSIEVKVKKTAQQIQEEDRLKFAEYMYNGNNEYQEQLEIQAHSQSKEYLNSGDFLKALETESTARNTDNSIVEPAINGLKQMYKEKYVELSKQETDQLINENKMILLSLAGGQHNFTINQSGEIVKESDPNVKLKNTKDQIKKDTLVFGFSIPINAKFQIKIMEENTKTIGKDTCYHMSPEFSNKKLKVNDNNKYFLSGFGAPFLANDLPGTYITDQEVKGLNVHIYNNVNYKVFSNDIYVGTKTKNEKTKEVVASKGKGRKVLKIVTAPLWGPFFLLLLII